MNSCRFAGQATLGLLLLAVARIGLADPGDEALFESRIRPVLVEQCFRCHGGLKISGGLRVDSRRNLIQGGESGPAIEPGQPASLLLRAIRREDNLSAMPPDKPLRPDQVRDFERWIESGAEWPENGPKFESTAHWAFQPIRFAQPPAIPEPDLAESPIDRFLLQKLDNAQLAPAPRADARTLMRRAAYDLTGLPPTFAQLDEFDRDSSPDAWDRVIDRLLASPQYGERWGRHWLDVVRYADTAGENSDHPLPHAWRYRNWVIRAFNRDLPYSDFIRLQIAGDIAATSDVSAEEYHDRIVATGFLALARRFGHDIDKDMHLTYEDTLDTLGKSVLGLTLGCARCHDHKYDPLTTRDYYGLYGVFESTRFAFPGCEPKQQPRDLVPLVSPQDAERLLKPFEAELALAEAALKQSEQQLSELRISTAPDKFQMLASGELAPNGQQPFDLTATPIEVQRGEMLQLTIHRQGNYGADSTGIELELVSQIDPKRRWQLPADLLDDFYQEGHGAQHADRLGNAGVWNFFDLPGEPKLFHRFERDAVKTAGLQVWKGVGDTPSAFVNVARDTIRFYTVVMPPRSFGLHPGPETDVALAWQAPVDDRLSIRGRIFKMDPGGDGVAWKFERRPGIGAALATQRRFLAQRDAARDRRDAIAARRPPIPVAFAVAELKPGDARIHKRGNPEDLGDTVARKFIDFLGGQSLQNEHASGRQELADCLVNRDNPLTARVIVNRIWQWHFGRGLVATPNDFGTRGAEPSHPELIDFLASWFQHQSIAASESGTQRGTSWGSIKSLHRRLMLSSAYQQASQTRAVRPGKLDPRVVDPDNRWLGSFSRRRLSAEELRDTLLAVSSHLDLSPGEAHPFPPESTWSFTQHAPFAADYDTNRRSVYVMQKRNRRLPFFALFDGPDPNASTPVRDQTTVPTQALYFLNDPFVHRCADVLAASTLEAESTDPQRLEFLYRTLLGRLPSEAERAEGGQFLREFATVSGAADSRAAWRGLARVLLGGSELLYVD